jgi:hypothetical protein
MAVTTVAMHINILLPPIVIADLATYWTSLIAGVAGTTQSALDGVMTSVTVVPSGSGPNISPGNGILIDQEPMMVTAVAGNVLTVTRSQGVAILPPPVAHLAGANISVLSYPDLYAMVVRLAVRPWIGNIVQGLGQNSQTYSAASTGSLASY